MVYAHLTCPRTGTVSAKWNISYDLDAEHPVLHPDYVSESPIDQDSYGWASYTVPACPGPSFTMETCTKAESFKSDFEYGHAECEHTDGNGDVAIYEMITLTPGTDGDLTGWTTSGYSVVIHYA